MNNLARMCSFTAMPAHGLLPAGGLTPHALTVTPASGTGRKRKDPNAPKRALSAYNIYVAQNRQSVVEAARNQQPGTASQSSNKEAMKSLGESWKVRDAALCKYKALRRGFSSDTVHPLTHVSLAHLRVGYTARTTYVGAKRGGARSVQGSGR